MLHGRGALECERCGSIYPEKEGIFDFRCGRENYYFNPVPLKEMDALLDAMPTVSWAQTVRRFLGAVQDNPDWLDNLVVDGRYAWKTLLNLTPGSVVLDYGCGLGNLSKNLAPHVSKMYAMDLTFRRLQFARHRFTKFNLGNEIRLLAGGDGPYLPFPDGFFDCIILSGVLEWIGEGDCSWMYSGTRAAKATKMVRSHFGQHNPRTIQLHALREIRRVLKKSGQLFIAIENRLNYEYFKGRPDHHSELRYGSLLPRFLANLYSIVTSRAPYRTYTYSIHGYTRLLEEAGFPKNEFFGFLPGYSKLQEIVPVAVDIRRWTTGSPDKFKDKIKHNKHFVPAFGIVSSPFSSDQPRLLDRLLDDVKKTLGQKGMERECTISRYIVTAKDKAVLSGHYGDTAIVLKLALTQQVFRGEETNCAMLVRLKELIPAQDSISPRFLARGQVNNLDYFVETQLKGQELAEILQMFGRTSHLRLVVQLLERMNPSRLESPAVAFEGEFYHECVSRPLESLFEVIEDRKVRDAVGSYFRKRLYGMKLVSGLRHGDFSVHNIIGENGKLKGLIDWGGGTVQGIPVLDAINYLDTVNRYFEGATISHNVWLLISRKWPISEEIEFLFDQYKRWGVNPSFHEPFVYLYWLQHISQRLTSTTLTYEVPARMKDIDNVVEAIISAGER
jgi:ubiquinone/menaquinone biosynthesis C-methylase UbiE